MVNLIDFMIFFRIMLFYNHIQNFKFFMISFPFILCYLFSEVLFHFSYHIVVL